MLTAGRKFENIWKPSQKKTEKKFVAIHKNDNDLSSAACRQSVTDFYVFM